MTYLPDKKRYNQLTYRRCGKSGLQLPPITLGLWHNFGGNKMSSESKKMIFKSLAICEKREKIFSFEK